MDSHTKIRSWGADWNQLMAERALIEAAHARGDLDEEFEKMLEIDRVRQHFRDRTHQPEPPHWE
jgi:hypothetical protein